MTPRETVIEAITRALVWNAWPTPEDKFDCDFFDLMKKANPEWWAINQQDATTALNALLAALPALGLKVVPVEATAKMMREFWLAGPFPAKPWKDGYAAMLAAAPDPLGGGE